MSDPILTVKNLKKYFPTGKEGKFVKAIDDVSFEIRENEVVGLVGESGSGKSTTAYTIMGMHAITSGAITYRGRDLSMPAKKRPAELKKEIQIVFQDRQPFFRKTGRHGIHFRINHMSRHDTGQTHTEPSVRNGIFGKNVIQ